MNSAANFGIFWLRNKKKKKKNVNAPLRFLNYVKAYLFCIKYVHALHALRVRLTHEGLLHVFAGLRTFAAHSSCNATRPAELPCVHPEAHTAQSPVSPAAIPRFAWRKLTNAYECFNISCQTNSFCQLWHK